MGCPSTSPAGSSPKAASAQSRTAALVLPTSVMTTRGAAPLSASRGSSSASSCITLRMASTGTASTIMLAPSTNAASRVSPWSIRPISMPRALSPASGSQDWMAP